jgi:hypothetical protein
MKRRMIVLGIVSVLALSIVAVAMAGKPDWWKQSEKTSDQIARQMISAVPYPTAQMRDSLERRNLRERLLRFNRPQKIGYLYVMSFGKFVGYYVVRGKVSSTQSQMTNADQVWDSGSGEQGETVVGSIGDDGSFGPNEGGDKGIFFFTATGVMVETTLDWVYSDAPLRINVPNLLKGK